jgi:hypothetical protein|eukprot:CAMPEP_0174286958 /NCGR_PEP_ID=MMETSP0809-20121228/13865_1 /TAXON_ID=73025 ORGANISM="Eutreptiella gymnastica-like, Strain CCMP1594" /NCGR_SAMPLE_ID=MMETSP0809 /ASSEMBLY_ACC=CAM_ASM_000658 /LENGTH=187 /DNA_ID=CAMNT_0015383261 /DNA_START=20 /DNA_END=583 /DNA_ORIENTATION=-
MADNPLDDEGSPRPTEYKPKAGRRRVNEDSEENAPQPATRKGWGDEEGTSTSPTPQIIDSIEARTGAFGDDEEEITEVDGSKARDDEQQAIPELENEGEEDFTKEIAEAPKNYEGLKVPQLAELEKESHFPLPNTWDDIDISILTSILSPAVEDEDIEWEPNQLFSQLTSELQFERDLQVSEEKPNT